MKILFSSVTAALPTFLAAGLIAMAPASVYAQSTNFLAWGFDNNAVAVNNSPTPSAGTGAASVLGMSNSYNGTTSVTTADVLSDTGSSTGTTGPLAWRIRGQSPGNGWSSQAPIGTQGAQFTGSTVGYNSIKITFDLHTTAQSEANLAVYYTSDGTNWSNAPIAYGGAGASIKTNTTSTNTVAGSYIQFANAAAPWYNGISADLSAIPSVNNNAAFAVKLVNASTGVDNINQSGTAYNNSSGNWRFDNVQFSGVPGAGSPVPSFSGLTSSQSILAGTATLSLSGKVSATGPLYPAARESVVATINGISRTNTFSDAVGDFLINFPVSTFTAGSYPITYFYAGSVSLRAASNSSTVLTITNLVPTPVVSITSPTNNANFATGTGITITASASETGGTVTNVAFYAGTNFLGNTASSPYTIVWPSVPTGNYSLTAIATDSAGISATSAVVNISVNIPNIPPTVTLTNPVNNASFSAPASIVLIATATDSDGSVTNVAFFQGSTKLADVLSFPFTFSWTNIAAGSYALTAVATDNRGGSATSGVVNISVTNIPVISTLPPIQTVFVIAMENHNWTQPSPGANPAQVFGNAAAPYVNSLVTPGNSNAAQVSFATHYYNVGIGVHGSEPNYVWAEGGTDFGVHTDNDPGAANTFGNPHLTAQLNTAGISWKNYQEDVQYSSGVTHSASGSGVAVNPWNGSTQYDYGVKHNPMAFFTDTQSQNVFPLTNFLADLTNNNIGRYNWITPDELNNMHSALSGGFNYKGTAYTGDLAAIAQGDNFLSKIIPQIMASTAYKSNGLIVIWWDETENGDTTNQTIGEIIISPFAKGNGYASPLEYSHSSDVKTFEGIFGLNYLSNSIPASETRAAGSGYNNVATVNDFSDMFIGNAVMGLKQSGGTNLVSGMATVNFGAVYPSLSKALTFIVTNSGASALTIGGIGLTGVNSASFNITGITLPATVNPSGSTNFQLSFAPTTAGSFTATLQVTNNDALHNPFVVNLAAQGQTLVTPDGLLIQKGVSNGYNIGFNIGSGQPYRVMMTGDLRIPFSNWTQFAAGIATTNAVVLMDTNSTGTRFFRVTSP